MILNVFFESLYILYYLLDNICKKHNISFINQTIVLYGYRQEQVMSTDLGYYIKIGKEQFCKYMNNF